MNWLGKVLAMADTAAPEQVAVTLSDREKERLAFIKWLVYDRRPPGYTDYVRNASVEPCRAGTGDE